MNQLLFEGRFLVNIAASIIQQDELHIVHSGVDWERLFRLADYHKISSLIYLGVLGNREILPGLWQKRFFERYQESLLYGEICDEAEIEILTLLEIKKIPCIQIGSTKLREFYQIREAAGNTPLRLLMDSVSYHLAKGYILDLGYETEYVFAGAGERMTKVSGINVEIYYCLPFRTHKYRKNMSRLMNQAVPINSFRSVRALSLNDSFIYSMARAAYNYATDELTIRDVIDLMLYHRDNREQLNVQYIKRRLEAFQICELAEKLLRIGYMWFGSKEEHSLVELPDELDIYDVLEDRLISRGIISKERDKQAISLHRAIHKEIEGEKLKEYFEKLPAKLSGLLTRSRDDKK